MGTARMNFPATAEEAREIIERWDRIAAEYKIPREVVCYCERVGIDFARAAEIVQSLDKPK